MSTIIKPADAMAFAKPELTCSWREHNAFSPCIASTRSYLFDLKSNNPLRQPSGERDLVAPVNRIAEEVIHPADRDFALAAREEVIREFEDAARTSTPVKASLQFRVISPDGQIKLVNQVLTPFAPSAAFNHQVYIIETDLTQIATNPVKTVRFYKGNEESEASTLKLKDFDSEHEICLFSDRQLQILRFLAEGQTTAEISKSLYISADTVRTHRQHILQRSNQANMTATVVDCVRKGWI